MTNPFFFALDSQPSTPRRGDAQRRRLNFQLAVTCLALAGLSPFATRAADATNHPAAHNQKFTYVIVHGAWGGGWDWKPVDQLLTADGHKVYRPTLTGQGERSHLASTNIDLDTHIQDIVNVILWEDLHDVVLVGHSYGGMVITGVADRVPDRIKHVIYLDAFVPKNGECANAIRARTGIDRPIINGFVIPTWITNNPPPPHDVPHAGQNLQRTHLIDQPGRGRKIAHDLHPHRGQGQNAGAGRFLSILSTRQGPGLDGDHHGRRPQRTAVASEGTRRSAGTSAVNCGLRGQRQGRGRPDCSAYGVELSPVDLAGRLWQGGRLGAFVVKPGLNQVRRLPFPGAFNHETGTRQTHRTEDRAVIQSEQ